MWNYGSSYGYPGRCDIVIRSLNSDEQSGGTDPNDDSNQNSTFNKPVSAEKVPMKDTETPISVLVLAVIGGLVYTKK